MPHIHDPTSRQAASERAALGGDVASQSLNEALRVSFFLLKAAMVLVAVVFLFSGVFYVREHERAFVLRFGKLVVGKDGEGVLGPGLHLAFPFLIDEVVRFPVLRDLPLAVESFWYKPVEEGQVPPSSIGPGEGGYNITGDANILHTNWVITYSIKDPVKLCERLTDPASLAAEKTTGAVADLLSALFRGSVNFAMAQFHVDDAIGGRQTELVELVRRDFEARLEQADVGIQINRVQLADAIVPPIQTRAAFAAVNSAAQAKEALINKAKGYYDKTVTEAKGEATRVVNEAMAYKKRVVDEAEGDAKYMQDLLNQYPDDPHMLRYFLEQRLIEVLEEVLEKGEIIRARTGDEIRIYLNRDPKLLREGDGEKKEE